MDIAYRGDFLDCIHVLHNTFTPMHQLQAVFIEYITLYESVFLLRLYSIWLM